MTPANDDIPLNSDGDKYRWRCTVYYRTEGGPVDVIHFVDEIEDLHDLIERGPHFDCLINIDIRLTYLIEGALTTEQAAKL